MLHQDDAEFGLPPVDNLPTLEEILAEDDELLRTIDDFEDDASSCAGFGLNDGGVHMTSLSAALHQLGIEGRTKMLLIDQHKIPLIYQSLVNKCRRTYFDSLPPLSLFITK